MKSIFQMYSGKAVKMQALGEYSEELVNCNGLEFFLSIQKQVHILVINVHVATVERMCCLEDKKTKPKNLRDKCKFIISIWSTTWLPYTLLTINFTFSNGATAVFGRFFLKKILHQKKKKNFTYPFHGTPNITSTTITSQHTVFTLRSSIRLSSKVGWGSFVPYCV